MSAFFTSTVIVYKKSQPEKRKKEINENWSDGEPKKGEQKFLRIQDIPYSSMTSRYMSLNYTYNNNLCTFEFSSVTPQFVYQFLSDEHEQSENSKEPVRKSQQNLR